NLIATIILALYLSLGFLNHGVAMHRLQRWTTAQQLQPLVMGAIPVPLSPLHQRGVVITQEQVYDIPLSLFTPRFNAMHTYPSPFREDPYIQKAWQTPEGQIFRWFARFPLATHTQNSPLHRIVLHDLRFETPQESLGWLGRWVARLIEAHDPELLDRKVFVLEIVLNQDGKFQQARFVH
ncbi:MAG: hypothetical protein D6736_21425, partial [Nitrospinota bacterium]